MKGTHLRFGTPQVSYAIELRKKRSSLLADLVSSLPAGADNGAIKLLDVGGTTNYWETVGAEILKRFQPQITLLNLRKEQIQGELSQFVKSEEGDACNLMNYPDGSFDIAFSNSVIEHVGDLRRQRLFAQEIMRVGRHYMIQTPNYWFPLEPHFMLPCFQYLPKRIRALIHLSGEWGWWNKAPSFHAALEEIESIRMLRKSELKWLFPQAHIYEEKWGGITKSFVLWK